MEMKVNTHILVLDGNPAENAVLAVTAADTNTSITVNVGASGVNDSIHIHLFLQRIMQSQFLITTTADCADVYNTVGNLIDILTDTISNAAATSPVDHLASVTKVSPAYEYLGATVDAYAETPLRLIIIVLVMIKFIQTKLMLIQEADIEMLLNLIRLNRGAIIDKAAYDMLQRYPALAQKCQETRVVVVEMEHYVVRLI